MQQTVPRIALQGRFPAPPPSRRVRPSIPHPPVRFGVSGLSTGMVAPPPSGDWAARSRHNYGSPVPYPPPARPEQIQRRWAFNYGIPGYAPRAMYGLGDAVQQVGAVGAGAATAAGTAAASAGLISAAVVPFIGPAIAGIVLGIEAILHSGCGNTCIVTSNWANQAEALLQQNLTAYMALATPRAMSAQAVALQNFDKIWNYLVQECSNPQLGSAGQRCISDRQAGACHYQNSGVCWNWFVGYRDPIANDRNVVPDAQSAQAPAQTQTVTQGTALPGPGGSVDTSTSVSNVLGGLDSKTLLLIGLGVVAVMYMGGKN